MHWLGLQPCCMEHNIGTMLIQKAEVIRLILQQVSTVNRGLRCYVSLGIHSNKCSIMSANGGLCTFQATSIIKNMYKCKQIHLALSIWI